MQMTKDDLANEWAELAQFAKLPLIESAATDFVPRAQSKLGTIARSRTRQQAVLVTVPPSIIA